MPYTCNISGFICYSPISNLVSHSILVDFLSLHIFTFTFFSKCNCCVVSHPLLPQPMFPAKCWWRNHIGKADACPVKLGWQREATCLSITPEDEVGWPEWIWPLQMYKDLGYLIPYTKKFTLLFLLAQLAMAHAWLPVILPSGPEMWTPHTMNCN